MARGSTERDGREVDGAWSDFQRHWQGAPAPDLAQVVAHYWSATWDLRAEKAFRQLIVPSLSVHLTFASDAPAVVRGVARRHRFRTLEGDGQVFGVAFRPGSFRPFLAFPVAAITDRSVPAEDVFGRDLPSLPTTATDEAGMAEMLNRFLLANLPGPDPAAAAVAEIVSSVAGAPDIMRVDTLADRLGVSVRQLQRQFAEHVGVGPKWVIRHYRLQEVGRRLATGAVVDWAGLAADLGYADQAHFSRDFSTMIGEPPTQYAERYPAASRRARNPDQ